MTAKLLVLRLAEGDTVRATDEAVLAACAVGDSTALGELFDRYHRDVYRFLGRFPWVDESGRDDLVQTTFLEIQRTARSYRGTSSVRTWVFGVASNVARHASRSERRRSARQAIYNEHPAPRLVAVDDEVEQRRLLERVRAAMAALPQNELTTFIMCDLDNVPGVEAAKVLGIPEGTVWRRLHTARKAIRDEIERMER